VSSDYHVLHLRFMYGELIWNLKILTFELLDFILLTAETAFMFVPVHSKHYIISTLVDRLVEQVMIIIIVDGNILTC
jgi:hypothetical protein